MSNTEGSYVLNAALEYLNEQGIFKNMSQAELQLVCKGLMKSVDDYWCRSALVFLNWLEPYGLCRLCLEPASDMEDGACASCLE